MKVSRRAFAAGAFSSLVGYQAQAARPSGYLVENSTHMFAADLERFPFHPQATYRPKPLTVEAYVAFIRQAHLDHTVIVQSEVYQDDHRYLEYCFAHEPSAGFFKGTCLFDPIDSRTPERMKTLVHAHPGRIVGIRIHELHARGTSATTTGPMRDRDLRSPGMKNTWRAAGDLGLLAQLQTIPYYAPEIAALASEFPATPVLIDHLAFPSRGTPGEYEEVIKLGKLPNVVIKVSSLNVASKEPFPHRDLKPMIRRLYDAFGPERLIWGSYGSTMHALEQQLALIDEMFDFAPEPERARIRGGNAMRLFSFAA
jgi:L-fuconolactonase